MSFEDILDKITEAVNNFNQRIPTIQKQVLDDLQLQLKKLDTSPDGKIKTTIKNLNVIKGIKNKILNLILTDEYKDEVKEFKEAFNEVTKLQNQYWQQIDKTYKPKKILAEIKKQAIADTVSKLTESGIGANIGDKITDILRTSITTGGSYADLTDQLRESLTTTKTPGSLERYAKQITTDSLNQYSAQYTQAVSSDLGYEWFKYDNTDIATTRPFCDAMTDLKYFHVSEIPNLLRAIGLTYVNKQGERVPVPIYAKTGLPHGMIPGTNPSSFQVLRGGYNCGHQIRPVNEKQVPEEAKNRVLATPAYIKWRGEQEQAEKVQSKPFSELTLQEKIELYEQQFEAGKTVLGFNDWVKAQNLLSKQMLVGDEVVKPASAFEKAPDLFEEIPPKIPDPFEQFLQASKAANEFIHGSGPEPKPKLTPIDLDPNTTFDLPVDVELLLTHYSIKSNYSDLKRNRDLPDSAKVSAPSYEKWLFAFRKELPEIHRAALKAYSQDFYYDLNKHLLGIEQFGEGKIEMLENAANAIEDALNKLSPAYTYKGVVYRGMTVKQPVIDKYLKYAETGEVFTEPHFVSTAYEFAGAFKGNVKFVIKSKTGVKIQDIGIEDEYEVLFNRNTKFRIIGYKKSQGYTGADEYLFEMEEI